MISLILFRLHTPCDRVRIALAHLPILHNRKHTNNISEQPNPITSQK